MLFYIRKYCSNFINSPRFCQQSYQLTSSKENLTPQPNILPFLDKFPQNKKPWLSFRHKTRSQITESAYLLRFLHSYFSTLDINTTVSTWPDRLILMSWVIFHIYPYVETCLRYFSHFVRSREYIHNNITALPVN